jgi:hypothetical protein
MIIAIDFDGTCVTHDFPIVGKDIGAIPVLQELRYNGHDLILYTMRSNKEKSPSRGFRPYFTVLQEAVMWFDENNISLFGINENPQQSSWTSSPKVYAHLYIDDAAAGCPLIYKPDFHPKSYVDWISMKNILISKDYIK